MLLENPERRTSPSANFSNPKAITLLAGVLASLAIMGIATSDGLALNIAIYGAFFCLAMSALALPNWTLLTSLLCVVATIVGLSLAGTASAAGEAVYALALAVLALTLSTASWTGRATWALFWFSTLLTFSALQLASYGVLPFATEAGGALSVGLTASLLLVLLSRWDDLKAEVLFLRGGLGRRTRALVLTAATGPWIGGLFLYYLAGVPPRTFPVEAFMLLIISLVLVSVALTSAKLAIQAEARDRQDRRTLETLAITDTLTDLPNRAGLDKALAQSWEDFVDQDMQMAVIVMDLDLFKSINDTFGHSAGDKVLSMIKGAITPHLRPSDTFGRWGGEEFLCLIAGAEREQISQICERLRDAVQRITPRISQEVGGICPITASFGVAFFRHYDTGYEVAIERADKALYVSKKEGRNRVSFGGHMQVIEQPAPVAQNASIA